MTHRSVDPIRLRGPSAVVAAVPYLLGFVPTESLVLLVSGGPAGRVELTLRLDLPESDEADVVAELLARLGHVSADTAIVVVFADPGAQDPPPTRWDDLVGCLGIALQSLDIHLTDALFVWRERWWSYLCHDPECCPPEGRAVRDSAGWAAAAEAVGHGLSAAASRKDFAAAFAPVDPRSQAETAAAMDGLAAVPSTNTSAWRTWRAGAEAEFLAVLDEFEAAGKTSLAASRIARLLMGLSDFRVRDPLLWHLAHASDDRRLGAAERLFATLVGGAPDSWLAPAATLLAIVCWQGGNGAQAQLALSRIPVEYRDYSLALLVARALDVGLPPTEWVRMLQGLDINGCRTGLPSESSTPVRSVCPPAA